MRSTRAGLAVVVATALGLTGCADSATSARRPASPPPVTAVDKRFVKDMTEHHERMIRLAVVLAAGGSTVGVRTVAKGIANEETDQLATLEGLYEGWTGREDESLEGGESKHSPRRPRNLTHDRESDLLRRMIAVHTHGLQTAMGERRAGANPAARLTAQRIGIQIRRDLTDLRRLLREARDR